MQETLISSSIPVLEDEHPAWDSLCFDYGKNEVVHFLLSNCKYWLDVFNFDGFVSMASLQCFISAMVWARLSAIMAIIINGHRR
jgi:hypothetical protein